MSLREKINDRGSQRHSVALSRTQSHSGAIGRNRRLNIQVDDVDRGEGRVKVLDRNQHAAHQPLAGRVRVAEELVGVLDVKIAQNRSESVPDEARN